jgi:hypothetical protein
MALQMNISLLGGAVVNNCYVRIHSVEAVKAKEDSDWTLKVLTNLYKDVDARSAGDPAGSESVHLHTPQYREYIFDYNPASEKGNLIAIAYDKLKTYEGYDGASDV